MADDSLNVSIRADVSQLSAGMKQAASATQAAAAQITAAFGAADAAAIALMKDLMKEGMSAEQAAGQMRTAGVSAQSTAVAFRTLASATTEAAAAATVHTAALTGIDRAMATATGRIAGMSVGAGMLGGALGRVGAASATLGPLLSAAFPVFAAFALVDILSRVPDVIDKIIGSFTGWDAAAKKTYDDIVSGNTKMLVENAKLKIEIEALNEIGAKGAAKYAIAVKDNVSALQIWSSVSAELLGRQRALQAAIDKLKAPTEVVTAQGGKFEIPASALNFFTGAGEEVKKLQKELTDTTSELNTVVETMKKLQLVEGPKAAKEQIVALSAELDKAAQKAVNEAFEYTKAAERITLDQRRIADGAKQLAEQQGEFGAKVGEKELLGEIKTLEERITADQAFRTERIADAEKEAVAQIDIQQRQIDEELRLGTITGAAALSQLNKLTADKLKIEMDWIKQRETEITGRLLTDDASSYSKDLAEWSKLQSQKVAAEINASKQIQDNASKTTNVAIKPWQEMFRSINSGMDSMIRGILMGTQSISQAFTRVGGDLLVIMTEALAKIALKHAATFVMINVLHKAQLAEEVGLITAGEAAKHAAQATSNIAQVTGDAGLAAAAAFASVMEAVPFPANVALAPGVAAAALAQVEAFGSIASAAGGMWQVPSNMLAMVHKDESILPAGIAGGLRKMVSGGSGGDIHVHYSPTVNAIDSRGMEAALMKHSDVIVKALSAELRRFNSPL